MDRPSGHLECVREESDINNVWDQIYLEERADIDCLQGCSGLQYNITAQ